MSKRFLTILVLSNDSSKTKQVKIPVNIYKFAKVSLVLLFLVVGFICYDYTSMRVENAELNRLKKENFAQKIELNDFSKKINDLEQHMAKLNVFDQKLRIIANLDDFSGSTQQESLGMGGTAVEGQVLENPAKMREELVGQMNKDIDSLQAKAILQERSFVDLQTHLREQGSLLASTPSIWPANGWLSSGFGKRRSPFTGLMQKHTGIDIANRKGTSISATADGTVIYVGRRTSAMGKAIVINHGYGIRTTYGHLAKYLVKKGQKVKRGQKIAEMGSTGRSTGPHLHYDIAVNGVSVDPMKYILN